MRIVKISDLSDDEKKKWQEQVQSRQQQRENNKKQEIENANREFEKISTNKKAYINDKKNDITVKSDSSRRKAYNSAESTKSINNNVLPTRKQYTPNEHSYNINDLPVASEFRRQLETGKRVEPQEENSLPVFIKKASDYLLPTPQKGVWIAKKIGTGIAQGTAGIGQSITTEVANNFKKGNEKSGNDLLKDIANSMTLNPIQNAGDMLQTLSSSIDPTKSWWENVASFGTNLVSGTMNQLPIKKQLNTLNQVTGKILPSNASNTVMAMNNAISKPLEDLNQKLYEEGQQYDPITQTIGNTGQVVGNMAPAIATTAITKNPTAGLAAMGISAKGQATQEALNKGATLDQAIKIGDTKGTIEIGTEMLTGGVNIFGKGALDKIVERGINKKIKNEVMNFLAKKSVDFGGEVVEEVISDLLGTVIDKGTVDPEAKYTWEDFGDTTITTILSTMVLNALGGGYTPKAYRDNVQNIQDMQKLVDNVQKNQETVTTADQVRNDIQDLNETKNRNTITGYHGTDANFDKFDLSEFGKHDNGDLGKAVYFSNNKRTASKYGKNIKIADINLENPLILNNEIDYQNLWNKLAQKVDKTKLNEIDLRLLNDEYTSQEDKNYMLYNKLSAENKAKIIQNMGFDGIIDNMYGQIAVFDTNKISNIANIQETLYNNIESESGINGEIYSRTIGRDGRIENEIADQRGQTNDTTISKGDILEKFKDSKQRSYEEFIEYANNNKIELDTAETERLKQLANNLGINVTLFNGDGINNYLGMTDKQNPNNVYIDINQKEIRGEDLLYHEFLHSRKRNNDSIYIDKIAPIEQDIVQNYSDIINNFIEEKGLDKRYKNYPELIAEEIIADYTSKHLGNLEIDYNLPQFYVEAINEAVNEMTNNVKASNVQQSSKVQNKDMKTIAPVAENQDSFSSQKNKYEIKQEQEQVAKILEQPTEKIKEKDRTWAILKANIIDKGIVFEELSHKTKNRELQGKWDYTLTATARGQNAIGQTRYEMDSKTKTQKQVSKSLEDIRTEVGNKVNDFQQYMYHQLNIDRMTLEERFSGDTGTNYERKDNIKNKPVFGESVTAEISQKIVQQYEQKNPEFKKWAKDIYDFNNANKKELVKMGVISQELSDKLAELYPHYVPIKRIDHNGNAVKVPLDTNRTGVNTPLARAKGGNSDIQPLFQTLADRTLQTYKASARNNFGVELMNTLNSIQEKQSTDIDTILEDIGETSNNEELLKEGKNGSSPTFTVFNNGEKVTFEITKDMYDALKPLSDSSILSKTIKPLNKISNFRRGVLTEYNPLFLITNAIKDMQDVVINSQHATKTYSKFPEAYSQIINKGYWYNEYIQNGGEQNSYFKDGEFESDKKTSKLKTAIKIPLDKISSVNNVIEMAPRLAEYIASREKGASIETSMLDASRVTTNFKAGGDVTKFANRNGATFLNASVQGFQQQIRNIQEAHVKGLKGYAVLATKYAVAGLPALILNGLIWKDDDDYEELQDYVKDNYYIVAKYEDGKFVRIPKGRMAATMQKIVSNVSNYIIEDKELNIDNFAKDFWEDLKFGVDNIAPNNPLDNNVISPIIQVITNKSWYGEDIVPSRLKDKPKAEQYDESTDSFSIWLGKKLNTSPYKINYLLDQYGGGVSDIALPMMTKQAENNIIEDKFTTNSIMKSKYPGEFFEMSDELKIKNNSENATDEDKLKYKYFSSISEETSKLYKKKREIQNSTLTDAEKKKQINEVQKEINSLAKKALNTVGKLKINKNTATIGEAMYYKTTDVKSKKETWKELSNEEKTKNENIYLSTYASYKEKIAQETIKQRKSGTIKEDGSIKEKDKINILINSNYTQKEKQELYENYILSSTDKKYEIIKSTGLNINTYLKYKLANSNEEFSADKKDDGTVKGKTITNSAKNKRYSYIKNMDATYMQKAILFGLETTPDKTDKATIVNYISSLEGKTNKEKLDMLSRFSWITIYKNGTFDF